MGIFEKYVDIENSKHDFGINDKLSKDGTNFTLGRLDMKGYTV